MVTKESSRALIERSANINIRSSREYCSTALTSASFHNAGLTTYLIGELKIDTNMLDSNGRTIVSY